MKDPCSVGDGARVPLVERLRLAENNPSVVGVMIAQLAGEAADALERAERLQSMYDDLIEGFDRLRADTDAAIKARCGENWETIRPLLKASSEHARSKP